MSFAFVFRLKNNGIYLLFKLLLPHKGDIEVVGLIGTDLRSKELRLDKVLGNDLHGLAVLFVDSQKEQGQHDDDHAEGCQADIAQRLEQKEGRQSDDCRRTEADELSLGQIEEYLGFNLCEVTGAMS